MEGAIAPNQTGWLWSEGLELYLGIQDWQLRYFNDQGQLIPTPEEAAQLAQQQTELTQHRAERLAKQLRSLGIEPEV